MVPDPRDRADQGTAPRLAFVAAASASGEVGGAERFFDGVCASLSRAGAEVDLLRIPSDESDFDAIQRSYLRFYDLDVTGYDGVITSKAPSYAVRHPNHVCYLQHTMRVFYDMFDIEFPSPSTELLEERQVIHTLDRTFLDRPRTRQVIAIGREVAQRLETYNGLSASVIRHPSTLEGLHEGRSDYLFLPGRLHRWKRVDMAIQAFLKADVDTRLVISGDGEDRDYFVSVANGDPRIEFVGRVDDGRLAELYSNALAVIFIPLREDLGLVTLEAFVAGKPVLTMSDSGEPAIVVEDGETGFVCAPDENALARSIARIVGAPDLARRLGAKGREFSGTVTWEKVADGLMAALGYTAHG